MDVSYSSSDATYDTGDFECNICFELAQDPIVTLCGHLYCWPCLYQWLQHHSHSHECPVCKAYVYEDKLIPIYGRGKSRSRLTPETSIPNRPMGQRPQTPVVRANYVEPNLWDPVTEFMPMAAARFGHQTLSSLFGSLPAIFNLQMNGFNDGTVYGSTSGVPYLFSSSFHGDYIHGFHHYHSAFIDWKSVAGKVERDVPSPERHGIKRNPSAAL
ncbi:E3 ubiquitin-protein ligase RMA3-like isoform X2 [Andrographis paniculata]|uniref:E3 ubiquitin-protein ligase RMA3-like isoform X2 n=1 Tax=Andrographis paniculata TaxID=175694 RepID=UPI0021E936D1|nr:E3 ubiquitin-protein ligase RMA3-like isoform X2 [Andrographis paniculata]XP_051138355.1 E3 ubiquitin-protein ligase RMA3-like isoform X2 [Andrographis paniculata]